MSVEPYDHARDTYAELLLDGAETPLSFDQFLRHHFESSPALSSREGGQFPAEPAERHAPDASPADTRGTLSSARQGLRRPTHAVPE